MGDYWLDLLQEDMEAQVIPDFRDPKIECFDCGADITTDDKYSFTPDVAMEAEIDFLPSYHMCWRCFKKSWEEQHPDSEVLTA